MAAHTNKRRGMIKGQPVRFIHGHNRVRKGISEADYRVEDRGFSTPCWIWIHYTNGHGYGKVGIGGRVRLAHAAMYEQEVGPITNGSECDHLCRVPPCIRPSHIELVRHRENVRRGRAQKLSYEDVLAIRADDRSSYVVAREFGISHGYAWAIQAGRVRVSD